MLSRQWQALALLRAPAEAHVQAVVAETQPGPSNLIGVRLLPSAAPQTDGKSADSPPAFRAVTVAGAAPAQQVGTRLTRPAE